VSETCRICGAVIGDQDVHDTWHENVTAAMHILLADLKARHHDGGPSFPGCTCHPGSTACSGPGQCLEAG
jgi:hypothetical protein